MSVTVRNAAKGTYTHDATGFTVCDIFSVSDAVEANGVLVYDSAGHWAWYAGRDLRLLLTKYGAAGSLMALAQAALPDMTFYDFMESYSMPRDSSWGAWNTSAITFPAMKRTPQTRTGLRIFGLVNNLAAGHGCSASLATMTGTSGIVFWRDATGQNASDQYIDSLDCSRNVVTNLPTIGQHSLGRGLIAIPGKSWAHLVSSWAAAVPDVDRSEVAEQVNAAIAKVDLSAVQKQLGVVPTILAPVVFGLDGKVYLEQNLPPAVYSPGAMVKNITANYSPFAMPALKERTTGWAFTNPLAHVAPLALPKAYHVQGGSFWTLNNIGSQDTVAPFDNAVTHLGSIDGVPLPRIIGGLARQDYAAGAAVASSSIANRAFQHSFHEEALSPQNAQETLSAYQARLEADYPNKVYWPDTTLFNHWQFAGQPTVIVTNMLNMALNDGSNHYAAATAAVLMSSFYSPLGREYVPTGSNKIIPRAQSRAMFSFDQLLSYVNQ